MKVFNKIITIFVLVLMASVPLFATGCAEADTPTTEPLTPTITIHTEFQNEYYVGEAINLTGGKIEYTDASGNKNVVNVSDSDVQISGFSSAQEGDKTLTISYQNCQLEYDYSVYVLHDVVRDKSAFYYSQYSLFTRIYNEDNGYTSGHPNYANPQQCRDTITFLTLDAMFSFATVGSGNSLTPSYNSVRNFSEVHNTMSRSIVNKQVVYTITKGTETNATITVINATQVRVQGRIDNYADCDYVFTLYNA